LHQWAGGSDKGRKIRCPYCVDQGEFLPMQEQPNNHWFMCERCGHLVMPENAFFKCTCRNCVKVYKLDRKPKRTTAQKMKLQLRYFMRRFR
jgi:hypothetical protein